MLGLIDVAVAAAAAAGNVAAPQMLLILSDWYDPITSQSFAMSLVFINRCFCHELAHHSKPFMSILQESFVFNLALLDPIRPCSRCQCLNQMRRSLTGGEVVAGAP